MKTTLSHSNNNHSSGAYITKRLIISSSRAAVRDAAARAIESVGYVIKAQDGWIIREGKDGSRKKIAKYKFSKASRLVLD